MPIKDIEKRKEYSREYNKYHYLHNRPKYLQKSAQHNIRYRTRNVDFIRQYKAGRSCSICGGTFAPQSLEFHHKNPDNKLDSIANMCVKSYSIKKILAEIEKCVLVCSNCHRGVIHAL